MLRSNGKQSGRIHVMNPEGCGGKDFTEKEGFKPGMKE